jgi:putative transposase
MSSRVVKRAYRDRFYPTPEQADLLNRTFGSVRYVYNRALAERSRAWTQEQRRITFADTSRMLTAWKSGPETAWLYEVSNVALQQGLQHLQQAYASFWGKRAKYPRFKSRHHSKASATFTTSGFRYRNGQLSLAKMSDPLDIRWSRPLPEGAEPSTMTVSRDAAGRWHISILTGCPVSALPQVGATVGIDAGITTLMTLSTGEKIANPRHERRDHLQKLSTRIIRESQTVIIEDLSVANMVRNHTLARAISDASWPEFRRMLEYKADWHGRTVVAIDRFCPSSKTCSACGRIAAKMPLSFREWTCTACGAVHDRDVNAAKVLRAAGLAVLACGDGVRPPRT